METLGIIALTVYAVLLGLANLRKSFKIGYYETKLINRGVKIDHVRFMPWYKLWLN